MRTIVVPLDGSSLAEQVLPTVRQLAPVLGARVRLLRVVEDLAAEQLRTEGYATQAMVSVPLLDPGQVRTTQHILYEDAAAYLIGQLRTFSGTSIPVDYQVRMGDPAHTILAVASKEPETLIALATHGYSGMRRWALGSVSDKVAQSETVPVLLVRGIEHPPLHEQPFNTILVPIDGSESSRQALPQALELAQQSGAQITLVMAINPHRPPFVWPELTHDEVLGKLQASAQTEVDTLAVAIRQASVRVQTVVEVGYPAEVILNVAARRHADLIVMATHGISGLRRWALGSVADKVLHAAETPLLLVRATPGTHVNLSATLTHLGAEDRNGVATVDSTRNGVRATEW